MPTTQTAEAKSKQLRLTTVVSAKQKKEAQKLAKDLTGGSVSDLVRQLIRDRYLSHLEAKRTEKAAGKKSKVTVKAETKKTRGGAKKKSSTTKSTSKKLLVRGSHGATLKPARKSSARNTAAKSTNGSTAKSVVTTKGRGKSAGTTAKNNRSTDSGS